MFEIRLIMVNGKILIMSDKISISGKIKRECSNYRIIPSRHNSLNAFKSYDVIIGYSILTLYFAIRSMNSRHSYNVTAKVKD